MILYGPQPYLLDWAARRLGMDWGPAKAIGVVRRHEVVAVVVYNQWRHPNIEASIASETPLWASREALRAILAYPFIQLHCKRVTATTEATNQRARAFLCRLGFREEGVHPDALPSGTAITYGLIARDAARWLKAEEYEQRRQSTSTP